MQNRVNHFFPSENHPFSLRKRANPCMDFHFHAWLRKSIMDLCIHDGFANPSWMCASMVTIRQAPSFSLRKEIPQKITLFSPQKQIHSPLPQKHASMQTRHGFPSEKPCFPLRIHGFILVAKSFDGLVNLDHSMPPRSRSHSVYSLPPRSMPHSHAHSTR